MAKIVRPIILQLRYLVSYKDILNELDREVEKLKRLRESIIHEDEAGIRDGEAIDDEAVRWKNEVDEILRDADQLKASRNANAVCLPNLKSRHQLGRKARRLTAHLHDLAAVKFERHRDELESKKWMKEIIVSALKEPDEINKIGIYGLEGVGDQTTLVKTVIKTVEDDTLFDGVIMTRVSETLDLDRIQCEIADQLGFHLKEMTTSERAGSLYEILNNKEKFILIIFYDVWGKIDLEKLGIPLEDHHKGCKLLLISKNQHSLQENEIEKKFSFRLKFLNDAELWSFCQAMSGAGVNEHDEKQILEPTNHSSLERICNELEDKVLQIFLLCGVHGKSILVSHLFIYIVGLELFKHINSIDDARNELKKIIGMLKASFPTLVYVDDREIQMNDLLRDIAKSVASTNAPIFTMERNVPLKYWPSEDFLRRCTQIILEGNHNIQKLPERLDCPILELLHLDSTGNRTLKIPDSFFIGMTNLQVLDLIGMVIQPQLPASLVSLTKLKTLCFNACSLGYMSGIGGLRNLEILSFCHSSVTDFPIEIGHLAHLRMLDLMSASEIEAFILPNILSNLTELEELYMGNLYILDEPFHEQLIIDSLKKLSAIKAKSCGQLKCLFLVSKIMKLSQLVDIEVSECGSMKNIVLLDSGLTIDKIESIPVRSLTLQHLPELNGFCYDGSEFQFLDIPTLFPNKEVLFRPLKHLKLIGISRIMLLVITALSNGMVHLQNLETLEIVGCNDLQYLFVIKGLNMYENYGGLLPDLRQFRLRNLVKLRSIVGLNHPRGTLSFKMLKDLIVCGCEKLRYVLPLYVLQHLHQLENIVINDCKMLERVFGDEEEDTQMTKSNESKAAKNTVELPRVNSLILEELPKFTGCCQDGCLFRWLSLKKIRLVECPMIKKLSLGMIDRPLLTSVEVIECNTWANNEDTEINIIHLFHLTDELSRLEKLKIKDSEELRKYMEMELQPSSFRRLKSLEALQCDQELTKFLFIILLGRSHELEELTIENCKLLEQIFKLEDLASDRQVTQIFPKLRTMRLNGLPKLNYICNNDPIILGTVKLDNLDKLEIIDCNFLKGPFPTTLLEKLGTLTIESCEMIEQVVEENAKMQGRLFCNLNDLQLLSLPKLTKFNSGHCNLTIPNLRSLKIEKCPELNAFTTGFLSNQTTNEGTSYDVPRDEKMDACLKLQTLKLVRNKTFEEIWQGRVSDTNITDCELKEVEVDSFNKLRYIFPSSMLPKLSEKLVTLVVRNCSLLSDVFRLTSENHSIKAFQNLKIVRLKGCDSLQRLLLPCNYPSLTEIDISDCQNLEDIFIDLKINAEEKCFPNLESIILENLPRLSSFSLEAFEFPKLNKVRIVNCSAIKTFSRNVSVKANNFMDKDSPFGHGKTILLPQLQVLELSDLPKMQLWNQEPQIPVFEKLTSLKIIGCGSIEYLFSISVAQHLSSLKSLTLYKCEHMVQVLQGGEGNSIRVFQKLETLVLKHLRRLSSFCKDKDVDFGEFPVLRMVRVEDIPNMNTFVEKPLKTPKLKQVHVIFIGKCWQGDLNETIKYLQRNHEKLEVKAWESDQSSTIHHIDTGESSSSFQTEEGGRESEDSRIRTNLKEIGTKSGEREIMEENQNSTTPPSLSVATRQTLISLDDADAPIDNISRKKYYNQLCTCGIFYDSKTKKVGVNKRLARNGFMIYAKSLTITWGEDPRYWEWEKLEERGTWIEVAELKAVCWLEVRGKLHTKYLSPGVMYGVSFHVMLKSTEYYSWSVKVRLKLAGMKYHQEHEMELREMQTETWMEIPVGQFVAPAHDVEAGEMEFDLWNYYDPYWKSGLIVKGVSVKPL